MEPQANLLQLDSITAPSSPSHSRTPMLHTDCRPWHLEERSAKTTRRCSLSPTTEGNAHTHTQTHAHKKYVYAHEHMNRCTLAHCDSGWRVRLSRRVRSGRARQLIGEGFLDGKMEEEEGEEGQGRRQVPADFPQRARGHGGRQDRQERVGDSAHTGAGRGVGTSPRGPRRRM